MIRVFDAVTESFLANLERSHRLSSQAIDEITSGYKLTKPSDAPADVISVLHIATDQQRSTQVAQNLNNVQNEVNIAESTIETAIDLMDRATVLVTQSLGLAQTAETRAGILEQVRDLQQQFVSLTQIKVQGRYVFSGDHSDEAQYTLDTTNTTTGVTRNFQTSVTREITDVLGASFTTALTAERLFDHRNPDDTVAADNVFAALEQVAQGLTNNDTATLETAADSLKTANSWLNTNLTFYGSVQNRIATALTMVDKYQVQWTQQLSEKRDADIAEAVTTLEQTRTQQSAALAAQANYGARSLFDYLK